MKNTKKVLSLIATFVMAMMIFVGCSSKPTTMTDREGNEFNVPSEINSIISTAPSNTEVLVELGLADKLVAVDKYSADVEGVSEDLPKIDFRNPDAETIISLNPDIVIASGHNKSGDEDPFALIKEAGITVVYIPSSYSIDGIYGDIEFIASLTGTEKKGEEIINSMKEEVAKIKAIGDTIADKKKVYFEIGAENPCRAGSAGADAVHLAVLRAAVCVQLYLRPGLHGGGAAGDRGACDLLAAKRCDPSGDCFPGQPAGPADGRRLAGGQGTGPAVCDPGRGVWLNRKRRIAGSECPAIF